EIRQEPAGHRRPAEDQGQRDPAALQRADDAGRRPLRHPLHPRGDGSGLPGRLRRRRVPRAAGRHLPEHAQDHHLRRIERSAAEHRFAGRSRLSGRQDMDFNFSDDQDALRDAVRKWVDRSYGFERRQGITKAGGFERAAYNELAELGLAGLYVAEGNGGMGMGPVEAMVVLEELGRGIVLEPLAQTLVTSGVLGAYAPEAVRAEWLPQIASGEALVVLAHQERKARYRLDACEAQATRSGGGWKVSGDKSVV